MQGQRSLGERMAGWARYILLCCRKDDYKGEERPSLQISGPTNFRKEDVSIPGLTAEQQQFIREKAKSDAEKMWSQMTHVHPLLSSPSGHLTSRVTIIPTHEESTTPPHANAPSPNAQRKSRGGWDRAKGHSRKKSHSFMNPLGSQVVKRGSDDARESHRCESKYETRSLINPVAAGKMSGDSLSEEGSDTEDKDRVNGFPGADERC